MKQIHASSHRTPIYRDAGFKFESIGEAEQAFKDERAHPQSSKDSIYTRYGNPTIRATESAIAELEDCEWSLLTSAGMSAIDTALSIFQEKDKTNTWLFFSELYGGTNAYIDEILSKRRGINARRHAAQKESYSIAELSNDLDNATPSVLFFESISNPLLIVPEAKRVIELAKERGIAVIVDNTFGTPFLWRPLEHGADIVVHSATKYLGGHGNLTAGVICGNDLALKEEVLKYRKAVGCILSPDDAYRLGTQLVTFDLRFARQCENASKLARLLEDHYKVDCVLYPGLPGHPTHQQALELFASKGFGAMITFVLKGGRQACDEFVTSARERVAYMPTLGDTNSILLHVSTVFGKEKYPSEGMIRFSVGCEPYGELERAVVAALEAVTAA